MIIERIPTALNTLKPTNVRLVTSVHEYVHVGQGLYCQCRMLISLVESKPII